MTPTRHAAFALSAAALLAATAHGGDVPVVVTGTVTVDTYMFGPYAGFQLGDTIDLTFEVDLPGTEIVPGQESEYDVDLATVEILHNGSPTSTSFAGPTVLTVENDNPTDGTRVSSPLANGDFMTCEFDADIPFFTSNDITQLLGSYDVAAGSISDNFILTGAGGFLRMSVDTLLLGDGPIGTDYCFGDGTGTPCPCGNTGASGEGCANSSGAGGLLTALASTSVGADDLHFVANQLLPGQPALLFVGEDALNGGSGFVFGDGLRCAGNDVVRLGVSVPDANGDASWGPGLGAQGGWSSGDVRRFQGWYRDPMGGPCGASFNLTNGVELAIVD